MNQQLFENCLRVSVIDICCFSLSYMIADQIALGFGLLVGQITDLKTPIWALGGCDAFFITF